MPSAGRLAYKLWGAMTIIKKKCWQECGEKGTLLLCLWKCKPVQPLWKTMEFSQKYKYQMTHPLHSWTFTQTKLNIYGKL